jgi:hypothetical protein
MSEPTPVVGVIVPPRKPLPKFCIHRVRSEQVCEQCDKDLLAGRIRERKVFTSSRLYEITQNRLGNCIVCGEPRGNSPYKRMCLKHGKSSTAKGRRFKGSKRWKQGGPGRTPGWAKKDQQI